MTDNNCTVKKKNDLQDGTKIGNISNTDETQHNNSPHYVLQKFGNKISRATPVQLSPSANTENPQVSKKGTIDVTWQQKIN